MPADCCTDNLHDLAKKAIGNSTVHDVKHVSQHCIVTMTHCTHSLALHSCGQGTLVAEADVLYARKTLRHLSVLLDKGQVC